MPTIDEPSGICGASARVEREQARGRSRSSVQSQCFSSVSSAGRITPGGGVVDEGVERPELARPRRATRSEETLPRTSTGSAPAARSSSAVSSAAPVVAQVADRHPRRAELGEPQRDRLADPARAARHEDGRALEPHRRPAAAARRRAPRSGSRPSRPVARHARALRRPSTRRGRAGRAAPSSPRRTAAPCRPPAGRGRAPRRARAAGRRSAASPAPTSASICASFVGSGMGKSLLGEASMRCRREGCAARALRQRRPDVADLMLLATVTLWALNFTVTKYVISHGFEPLAYAALRFGGAALALQRRSRGPASARSRCGAATSCSLVVRGADRDLPEPARVRRTRSS